MTKPDGNSYCLDTDIVLDEASLKMVLELIDNPPEPTEALKRLMRGEKEDE